MRFGVLCFLAMSALGLSSGCDGTISVTFMTGPQEFAVSTDAIALPMELRDGSQIASVQCGPNGWCPSSSTVPVSCEAMVCDPAPHTISVPVGSVVDVGALLAETREVGLRAVDAYEFVEVAYDVQVNSLTVPIEPVAVYWGPEAATAIDPALGVRRFGTVPRIEAGMTGSGRMDIDTMGAAELSDYLVNRGQRIRFFAQTSLDLDPGDPFPEGTLRVAVNATLRAVGSILE